MRYDETEACKCRWGDCAEPIFRDLDIIWECSEADYQGSANVLAYNELDDTFVYYGWSYGS